MSQNYIKLLLNPIRESKVLAGLIKWFDNTSGNAVTKSGDMKKEVIIYFTLLKE